MSLSALSAALSDAATREAIVGAAAGVLAVAATYVVAKVVEFSNPKHEGGPHPHTHPGIATVGPSARYFQARSTGLWLFHRTWKTTVSPVRGHIFLVHGAGEHSSRYEHVAEMLNQKGYHVHSMDLEGHGMSEGTRCYFERLSDPVDSIVQAVLEVKQLDRAKEPVYLFGHSMGGLLSLHVAEDERVRGLFSGVILSGPALSFDKELDNPATRALANTLSSVLPKMPVKGLNIDHLSRDPMVCASYKRDPLTYHGALKLRFGACIMQGVEQAKAFAGRLTAPVLIIHGEDDQLCKFEGSKAFLPLLTACPDKTLKSYPGLYHEILNESTHYAGIVDYVDDWMGKRRNKGGSAARK